ncbi:uncharacterized protein PRCAT00000702001 [Priceomyces carsonii]|uniref:uncharacterized protein n=1 Tax=Priceomyces carsonii TaxID=28549 RepID=UPI002ED98CC7|nr:unnamed protein product [Priceomyces carsonii]
MALKLIYVLPQKFLGVIPLYIGVELILGVAILNKAGGAYGVLSIITGHPINFLQWLYNLLALLVLPFYIYGLSNLRNRSKNVKTTSLTCMIYIIDTIVGSFYTIYFIYFWFSHEDKAVFNDSTSQGVNRREQVDYGENRIEESKLKPGELSSGSASPARELFVTLSTVLVVTTIRIYLTLVILSFERALLKQDSISRRYDNDSMSEDRLNNLSSLQNEEGRLHKLWELVNRMEVKSVSILQDFFHGA